MDEYCLVWSTNFLWMLVDGAVDHIHHVCHQFVLTQVVIVRFLSHALN